MPRQITIIFALVLFTVIAWAADPAPPDLAEYKTPATAATAQIQRPSFKAALAGHLGISVEPNRERLRVARIEPGSAAEAAGLVAGDDIKSIMGQTVSTPEAVKQQLSNRRAGETIEVVVIRGGKDVAVSAKLQAHSNPLRDPQSRPVLGVQLIEEANGVKIEGITPGSPAENAGLLVGDIVTGIDGTETKSLQQLRNNVGERFPGDVVSVEVRRAEAKMALPVKLALPPSPDDMPTLTGWDANNTRVFRRPAYRLAVIPVSFADVTLNEKVKPADWEKALFSTDAYKETNATGQAVFGSLNDFYRELSFGKFEVKGKVFDGVTVGKKRSEYTQTPIKTALLAEACDQLIQRDGEDALKDFDGIFFIHAGRRMQTQRTSIFWPHRSSFSYKGKRWAYFICPEGGERGGNASSSERMASISVISHEFGHMLGLPDLYARPDNPGEIGLGVWCSMSTGHGQDGKPLHFSAWCKEQMGWLKPAVLDPRVKQKLILAPVLTSEKECYKVLLRQDGSEYLLLENRIKKNFDRDLPGEGLLIWRVVDGRPVLEESHGIGGNEGTRRFLGSVPYPSQSNRAFTPDTTPSSRSLKSGAWPVHITDIRRLEDGRITFQIGFEYL
jgi:M6 family metalloprotease-like protein